MISPQQVRRAAALTLALVLLLWAETGLAMLPAVAHGASCRGMSAAAAHACCPQHAASRVGWFTHSGMAPAVLHRPDCCAVRNRPTAPLAFLAASGTTVAIDAAAYSPAGVHLPSAQRMEPAISASPPFTKSVFERKTDLRI